MHNLLKYVAFGIFATLSISLLFYGFALKARAQVIPSQNQQIIAPYGGFIVATSSSGNSKLSATTTPYFASFFANLANIKALTLPNQVSTLLATDADGNVGSYAGTTCTNEFIRALNALGVATCDPVDLSTDVTGILALVNGGTGANNQNDALNNLLPSQGGNAGEYLTTDGSNASWATVSSGGSSDWQVSNGALTPTTTIPVVVGTTTKPFFSLPQDIFTAATSTNNFASIVVANASTGDCATAELDALSSASSLTKFFSAFGHTGSGFTGSGCADTPYTDFGANSTYIVNPNGNINIGLATSSPTARIGIYAGGYADVNRLITIAQPGRVGIGINNPTSALTISTAGTTTSIIAPQAGTQIHLASSGTQNARITGDVYTNATDQGFVFQGRKSRGGVGSPTAVNANDTLAVLGGVGYGTTGFPNISAGAYVVRAEASGTDTSQPTYLAMLTTPTGTITPIERLRITSTGSTGIATSSPYAKLSIAGTNTSQVGLAIDMPTSFSGNVIELKVASSTIFSVAQSGALTLATPLTVANGGTGRNTFTSSQLIYGNGTNALSSVGTSTLAFTSFPANLSGTLGALVGGTNSTLTWWGLATSTAMADTQIPYGTGVNTLGSEAAFIYTAASDRLTVVNASTTALSVSGNFTLPYSASQTLSTNGETYVDSTSNQFKYQSGGATRVLGDGNFYPSFTYATTSWTGTTTLALGPAYTAETWNGFKCFTDTGTVNVSFNDGTNRMNMFNASTTVGTVLATTNNTFTASEKRYVDVGTPASSPTVISCTVSKSITAD